ncbi:hypothetical protein C5C66_04525 [Rathayibacter toxicus]|uniref:Uncharacterized protein n=1 Tax=Rathayibacter toxicus TaxID=145458 RepID=A0A0C5BDW3_9MICO|nr:hypothetical protein TI83_04735 [Rathayibacter toxicus]ALS56659.1 hypothetical protein APU90_01740 [Rathayibacter toxicus]KKM44750.1 hypothetical protein VT73_09705 [Rathayibacter toxicus]PPG21507.1 hypothetical protein C5D15_04500 [Rathayibacter toxicus]PPG46471.1 hypothetical protein C5D16_04485 [Rathayibacter toxicus]
MTVCKSAMRGIPGQVAGQSPFRLCADERQRADYGGLIDHEQHRPTVFQTADELPQLRFFVR